jgi:hypothetical protein
VTELTPEQQADKFRNRRKMAWRSWWLIAACGIGLLLFGLMSDEYAARVSSLDYVITVIFGVWATIVITYFGAASMVDFRSR